MKRREKMGRTTSQKLWKYWARTSSCPGTTVLRPEHLSRSALRSLQSPGALPTYGPSQLYHQPDLGCFCTFPPKLSHSLWNHSLCLREAPQVRVPRTPRGCEEGWAQKSACSPRSHRVGTAVLRANQGSIGLSFQNHRGFAPRGLNRGDWSWSLAH